MSFSLRCYFAWQTRQAFQQKQKTMNNIETTTSPDGSQTPGAETPTRPMIDLSAKPAQGLTVVSGGEVAQVDNTAFITKNAEGKSPADIHREIAAKQAMDLAEACLARALNRPEMQRPEIRELAKLVGFYGYAQTLLALSSIADQGSKQAEKRGDVFGGLWQLQVAKTLNDAARAAAMAEVAP